MINDLNLNMTEPVNFTEERMHHVHIVHIFCWTLLNFLENTGLLKI